MILAAVFLFLSVAGIGLATWGFVRLASPYDRVHSVMFAGAAAGIPLVIAAFATVGASPGAFKVLLIVVLNTVCGMALVHAVGRALLLRDKQDEGQ